MKLDSVAERAAFAVAAARQPPDKIDPDKLKAIAVAFGKFTPSSQVDLFRDLGSGDEWRVAQYVETVINFINTKSDGRPKDGSTLRVTAADLLRAFPYYETLTELRSLPAADQEARAAELIGTHTFAARIHQNFPASVREDGTTVVEHTIGGADGVTIRGTPETQIEKLTQIIGETLGRISKAKGAERDGLRERAADLFATLLNVMVLAPKRARDPTGMKRLFEQVASHNVPGFLPSEGRLHFEVLGQQVTTKLDFRNPPLQMVGMALCLGPRGDDPSLFAPGKETPEIPIAMDRQHLGTPNSPLGFVSKDGRYAFIPGTVDVLIMERASLGPERQLGFDEAPKGPFRLETRFFGAALKVPLQVEVGGNTFRLIGGEYTGKGTVDHGAGQITLSSGGQTKVIDTKTGAVK